MLLSVRGSCYRPLTNGVTFQDLICSTHDAVCIQNGKVNTLKLKLVTSFINKHCQSRLKIFNKHR